jgi:hypothetical protein
MAVLNNQAFIYLELGMMKALDECYDKVGEIFRDWEILVQGKHRDAIFLHIVILIGYVVAPAA